MSADTKSKFTVPGVSTECLQLFQEIRTQFQCTSLGDDRWYVLTLSALTAGGDPELADQLYLYLTSLAQYTTSGDRQELIRRLRETLVKCVSIVGVCRPLEAIMAINKVERDDDKDHTFSRENWACDAANHQRGMNWMSKLYSHNVDATLDLFKDHKDFQWISSEITYGLYLSDRSVLDDLDTQMVVFPGIMMQNLRKETHWHIRGTRRIGVASEDMEVLWHCVQRIAAFSGVKLSKVPTVKEVESDV